jgi:uncharacterized metal-binding protein
VASGKTHASISCALAVVLGPVVAAWTNEITAGLCFAGGCVLGVFISPDLDQEQKTISEALVAKLPVLGWLFRLYFYPYAWVFPHRSPFTHLPFLGTVIRALYIVIPLFILSICKIPDALYNFFLLPYLSWHMLWLLAGLCASDIFHWMADGYPTRSNT